MTAFHFVVAVPCYHRCQQDCTTKWNRAIVIVIGNTCSKVWLTDKVHVHCMFNYTCFPVGITFTFIIHKLFLLSLQTERILRRCKWNMWPPWLTVLFGGEVNTSLTPNPCAECYESSLYLNKSMTFSSGAPLNCDWNRLSVQLWYYVCYFPFKSLLKDVKSHNHGYSCKSINSACI